MNVYVPRYTSADSLYWILYFAWSMKADVPTFHGQLGQVEGELRQPWLRRPVGIDGDAEMRFEITLSGNAWEMLFKFHKSIHFVMADCDPRRLMCRYTSQVPS